MSDLFDCPPNETSYSAKDIEVLEGLEPVRRRPGMYIGGTDEHALHHLVAEILDNAMDEAVTGHATRIDVELGPDNTITVKDDGRGIPVDPHPRFPDKSALEVICTTLHSGGKFGGNVYTVSGGLHGVGLSVVNALAREMTVEVAREGVLWRQNYAQGRAVAPLSRVGSAGNQRGTTVRFTPDGEIFGSRLRFRPAVLYRMCRSKAYLFRRVRLHWRCEGALLHDDETTPVEAVLHFPNGLVDFLGSMVEGRETVARAFAGEARLIDTLGQVEWAVAWPLDQEGFCTSYCNTIPTPEGGTHEAGLRNALTRSLRAYGEMVGNRRAALLTAEDVAGSACMVLSLFLREPQFQGQTKEKLASVEATRLVETAIKDPFDHWLSADSGAGKSLLDFVIERAEERQRRKQAKETARKTATRRLRLPGKLADCSRTLAHGTELFIVEGDSAGGSAKQGRNRETQAILPLKGKILNVASASEGKLAINQELKDLVEALGCGTRGGYEAEKLRYEKVIIMTDADVDGAHIASLLMTFFFREMPGLMHDGHLYLAMPPLYRLTQGSRSVYARDDAHKERLLKRGVGGTGKIEVGRFKGLGEMSPQQLRETTMDPTRRTLLKVVLSSGRTEGNREEAEEIARLVERLMGRKPELRFQFIQERAKFVQGLDI
ncbi:MAG: topoisomerase IV subunit B [Rhodospirillaceae bacterium]|nr:MAG: topoisomerase IV subunit B [Rhodospirillaceae bacterium]